MKKIILALLILLLLSACSEEVSTTFPPSATDQAPTFVPLETEQQSATETPVIINESTNIKYSSVDEMPQIHIPAGTFQMGGYDVRAAPDEFPAHEVTLNGYWIDQIELTNAMYNLCVQAGSCTLPQNTGSQRRKDYYYTVEFKDYPVVYVTWGQAKSYCEWAGRRLPTEAEWERAARGEDMRTFPWGEDKADERYANFNMLVTDTSRVGSYALGASPYDVLDMAGNVAEWTSDLYSSTYYASDAALLNPTGPAEGYGLRRVVRGGSLGDAEINIRVSKRSAVLGSDIRAPEDTDEFLGDFSSRIGFRCVEDE